MTGAACIMGGKLAQVSGDVKLWRCEIASTMPTTSCWRASRRRARWSSRRSLNHLVVLPVPKLG